MVRVMFLCTGNTCRSHMAEGFARDMGSGLIDAHSAGVKPAGIVHPRAIAVMAETGIDISGQKSKGIDHDLLSRMDIVVTLCGNAEATCPVTPAGIRRLHWPIDDPVTVEGTAEEVMQAFRAARDQIRGRISALLEDLRTTQTKQ